MKGKLVTLTTPYYNVRTGLMDFKSRPALVIGEADAGDYVVLPVSRVSDRRRISPRYDMEIIPSNFPQLNLKSISYVRTHKQFTTHKNSIHKVIADFRGLYEDKYIEIISQVEAFQKEMLADSI